MISHPLELTLMVPLTVGAASSERVDPEVRRVDELRQFDDENNLIVSSMTKYFAETESVWCWWR